MSFLCHLLRESHCVWLDQPVLYQKCTLCVLTKPKAIQYRIHFQPNKWEATAVSSTNNDTHCICFPTCSFSLWAKCAAGRSYLSQMEQTLETRVYIKL